MQVVMDTTFVSFAMATNRNRLSTSRTKIVTKPVKNFISLKRLWTFFKEHVTKTHLRDRSAAKTSTIVEILTAEIPQDAYWKRKNYLFYSQKFVFYSLRYIKLFIKLLLELQDSMTDGHWEKDTMPNLLDHFLKTGQMIRHPVASKMIEMLYAIYQDLKDA